MQDLQHLQAGLTVNIHVMNINELETRVSQPPQFLHFRSAERALTIIVKRINHHERKYDAGLTADDTAIPAIRISVLNR